MHAIAFDEERVFLVANPNSPNVEAIRFDRLDQLLLGVFRHLFAQQGGDLKRAWMPAVDLAERMLDQDTAAKVVARAAKLLNEVATARCNDFQCMSARDPLGKTFITPDERSLIRLLHFLRIGERAAVQTQIIMLCEGRDGSSLLDAAQTFADVLTAPKPAETPLQQKVS